MPPRTRDGRAPAMQQPREAQKASTARSSLVHKRPGDMLVRNSKVRSTVRKDQPEKAIVDAEWSRRHLFFCFFAGASGSLVPSLPVYGFVLPLEL